MFNKKFIIIIIIIRYYFIIFIIVIKYYFIIIIINIISLLLIYHGLIIAREIINKAATHVACFYITSNAFSAKLHYLLREII